MATFNRVILLGNLTRDPEVRYTPSGTAVSEIGMALNRRWFDKNANETREETTFVDVTLWGRTAEIAGEYLSKGRQVLIEGRLQLDSWEDRETGQKRSKLRVVGEQMTMVGGRGEGGGGGGTPRPQQNFGGSAPSEPSGFEPSGFESQQGSSGPSDDVPF